MNSIQKIESAVYAIGPELKELSFGSKVQKKGEHFPWVYIGTEEHPKMDGTHNILIDPDRPSRMRRQESLRDYEILPATITLQDILLAMGENWSISGEGYFIRINWYGDDDISGMIFDDDNGYYFPEYNLRLSPYDQSTEVKDFIANNIVGTN